MRGAGGEYTYRYPVGRLDDEIGQAQGLWKKWWITGHRDWRLSLERNETGTERGIGFRACSGIYMIFSARAHQQLLSEVTND